MGKRKGNEEGKGREGKERKGKGGEGEAEGEGKERKRRDSPYTPPTSRSPAPDAELLVITVFDRTE